LAGVVLNVTSSSELESELDDAGAAGLRFGSKSLLEDPLVRLILRDDKSMRRWGKDIEHARVRTYAAMWLGC
jgi:hypothetical protein